VVYLSLLGGCHQAYWVTPIFPSCFWPWIAVGCCHFSMVGCRMHARWLVSMKKMMGSVEKYRWYWVCCPVFPKRARASESWVRSSSDKIMTQVACATVVQSSMQQGLEPSEVKASVLCITLLCTLLQGVRRCHQCLRGVRRAKGKYDERER